MTNQQGPTPPQSDRHAMYAKIEHAMKLAGDEALRLHQRFGQPLVVWQDGKVVLIPPEEIMLDEPDLPN